MGAVIALVVAAVAVIVVHECGHYVVAACMGKKPTLVIEWAKVGRVSIPRPIIFVHEEMSDTERRAFGIGGFAAEFAFALGVVCGGLICERREAVIFGLMMQTCAVAHLTAYPFYNKGHTSNDFNKLV